MVLFFEFSFSFALPGALLFPGAGPAAAAPSQRRVRRGAESYPRPRARENPPRRSLARLTAESADPSRGVGPVAGGDLIARSRLALSFPIIIKPQAVITHLLCFRVRARYLSTS